MLFKKKITKTGEIVRVVQWQGEGDKRRKTDWVSYIDSKGGEHEMVKGLNFYWDFEEPPRKWEDEARQNHFCLFAGFAMKGILSRGVSLSDDMVVRSSVDIAKALMDELENWRCDDKGNVYRVKDESK